MNTKKALITAMTVTALTSAPVFAADNTWKGEANDAWLDGKLETALMLNGELNNFEIDTQVQNAMVTLTGDVQSETEKDLAGQIAMNIEGVQDVTNNLTVKPDHEGNMESASSSFARSWHDMTITAGLNMEFAASSELEATAINVDTEKGIVTLKGEVDSSAAKDLAVEMAKGYDNVIDVQDELTIKK
jgi:hyperosmotically inducible protein